MSDCRFGVSPVNYPDPDPDPVKHNTLILFGQTVQSLVKCGSCHCIFRLLQIFLPLFSWKKIVNLNNQSGSQYLTE